MEVNYWKFLYYRGSGILSLEGRYEKRVYAVSLKVVTKTTNNLSLIRVTKEIKWNCKKLQIIKKKRKGGKRKQRTDVTKKNKWPDDRFKPNLENLNGICKNVNSSKWVKDLWATSILFLNCYSIII